MHPKKIRKSTEKSSAGKAEGVFDVAYSYFGALEQHADHVKPVRLRLPPVAIDPDHGRALQFPLFAPVNCLNRTAELCATAGFYLDKRHQTIPFDHQIDVAMAVSKPALDHAPAPPSQPSLRDSFSELAKDLPGH
jgi:hypothetical protein